MNVPFRHARARTAGATLIAAGAVPRIKILPTLAEAEGDWRRLEDGGAIHTPYQRFDWIAPWQRHIGDAEGVTPLIVIGFDGGGQPLFLLPLGYRRLGPFVVARFLGGKHANFNFGLWRREVTGGLSAATLRHVLDRIAQAAPDIDVLALTEQPESWDGAANPFRLLPHQPSPSFGYRCRLSADFKALLGHHTKSETRKKLRRKEHALGARGAVRYMRAQSREDALAILDAFFVQKAGRMSQSGRINTYAAPGVRDFITEGALAGIERGHPVIELYALSVGGNIVATIGGTVANGRFCAMFNSVADGGVAHFSPGTLLLLDVVRRCCTRRLAMFDLGVGEADYKMLLCDEVEPLFDSVLPLRPRGRLPAAGLRALLRAKRLVKQTPALWSVVHFSRRLRASLTRAH